MALIGGDERIVTAHDRAVKGALAWVERDAAETRLSDPVTGRMVRAKGQKTVAATFRHDTSRNLDPQLHSHAVLANMVRGGDGKWRTMANEPLYRSQKLIGMIYRNANWPRCSCGWATTSRRATRTGGSRSQGVSTESHRGCFPPAAPRSRRRWPKRGLGDSKDNPKMAERAALMTRAHKRDVDKNALREHWKEQAAAMGFDPGKTIAQAREAAMRRLSRAHVGKGRRRETSRRGTAA